MELLIGACEVGFLQSPAPVLPSGQGLPGQRVISAEDGPSPLHVPNLWGFHSLETPPPSWLGESGWQRHALPGADGQTAQPDRPLLSGK